MCAGRGGEGRRYKRYTRYKPMFAGVCWRCSRYKAMFARVWCTFVAVGERLQALQPLENRYEGASATTKDRTRE